MQVAEPGDLLVALRFFGQPVVERDGSPGYVDGGEFRTLDAGEEAVRRVMALVGILPLPDDVLIARPVLAAA